MSSLIAKTSNGLLEIVNLNVEGEQYVCAGSVCPPVPTTLVPYADSLPQLRNIETLTKVLNQLARSDNAKALLAEAPSPAATAPPSGLETLVAAAVASAQTGRAPHDLSRGVATIPLKGIDVPFHSSQLRGGVDSYRRFLQERVHPRDVQWEKLVGRFIPNVMAKPFSVEKAYIEEAARVTGSETLREAAAGIA